MERIKFKMRNDKSKLKFGFTLIEMMVALAVFMVVMTITLAAFLNIVDIQKKTEAFRKVNDNLNFSMEMMMREIREGKGYGVDSSGKIFTFISRAETLENDNTPTTVTYSLNENKFIERCVNPCSGNEQRITSEDVNITSLYFTVRGENPYGEGDGKDYDQPRVTISISGESGVKKKIKTTLDLQATVSQRKIDS